MNKLEHTCHGLRFLGSRLWDTVYCAGYLLGYALEINTCGRKEKEAGVSTRRNQGKQLLLLTLSRVLELKWQFRTVLSWEEGVRFSHPPVNQSWNVTHPGEVCYLGCISSLQLRQCPKRTDSWKSCFNSTPSSWGVSLLFTKGDLDGTSQFPPQCHTENL